MSNPIEVYFLFEDVIKSTVDLVQPNEGSTHKSSKAQLYEKVSNKILGYITIDTRGASTPDNSRVRSCQTNIILDNLKINIIHGSEGLFGINLTQPTQIVGTDFNGIQTVINYSSTDVRGFLTLNQ